MNNLSQPDLTQHPPRSVRVRLGGYAHLPRLLDKARAMLAGKNGEYAYNCPLDQRFFTFTQLNPDEMLAAIKSGKSDTEMLAWVNEKASRQLFEVLAWSNWLEQNSPGDADTQAWFTGVLKTIAPQRADIRSYADLLDLDDYISYGGQG